MSVALEVAPRDLQAVYCFSEVTGRERTFQRQMHQRHHHKGCQDGWSARACVWAKVKREGIRKDMQSREGSSVISKASFCSGKG